MFKEKDKNIAVMTWVHYHNYGTALQAVALKNIINTLGYNVENINYISTKTDINYSFRFMLWRILRGVYNRSQALCNTHYEDATRNVNFSNFIAQYLTLTSPCLSDSDFSALNGRYAAFICGSDQIWSPACFDARYFLDFVKNDDKKIAYAPSLGLNSVPNGYIKKRMAELISSFNYLSVREDQGKQIVHDLCHRDASVVLDPTLLLSAEEWDTLLRLKNHDTAINKPYLLCYFLGHNSRYWKVAKIVSEKLNIPIRVIPIYSNDLTRGFEIVYGVGPVEFVDLIRGASYICTDSFHGIAFSILYNKPFYALRRFMRWNLFSQNSRICNILNLTGLDDRLEMSLSLVLKHIDWKVVNNIIIYHRTRSKKYLSNALHDVIVV